MSETTLPLVEIKKRLSEIVEGPGRLGSTGTSPFADPPVHGRLGRKWIAGPRPMCPPQSSGQEVAPADASAARRGSYRIVYRVDDDAQQLAVAH